MWKKENKVWKQTWWPFIKFILSVAKKIFWEMWLLNISITSIPSKFRFIRSKFFYLRWSYLGSWKKLLMRRKKIYRHVSSKNKMVVGWVREISMNRSNINFCRHLIKNETSINRVQYFEFRNRRVMLIKSQTARTHTIAACAMFYSLEVFSRYSNVQFWW